MATALVIPAHYSGAACCAYNAYAMRAELEAAASAVADRVQVPELGVILGSGLGAYAECLTDARVVPYAEIPHMPNAAVLGHAGNLVVGSRRGKRIVALQGRAHLYEGCTPDEVVFGVRLIGALGVRKLVVTNSAGAISTSLDVGDLMVISDQLNLTGTSSLRGANDDRLGPRFVDMNAAFDPEWIDLGQRIAFEQGFELKRGVYAGVLGPAYETPAEVRMLRSFGADAVGMSTVLEVLAARHMGLRVLGISCISNLGSGMGEGPLSHEEVVETGARIRARFERLCDSIVESI